MSMYTHILFILLFLWYISREAGSLEVFVTPNRTCGKTCTGDIINPYDNLLFAFQNTNDTNSSTTIILLGKASEEHHLLTRELDELNSSVLLYNFSDSLRFTTDDLQIRPLFCDEKIVETNFSLIDKCIYRDQSITVVLKPMEITLVIGKKLSIKNIAFDWSESSKSINSSNLCTQMRKRCCNSNLVLDNQGCAPKFYTKKPDRIGGTFSFIELSSEAKINHLLSFDFISLKNFRDKNLRSFIKTHGNGTFDLTIQNSVVEDVTFGKGLISHEGTGNEILNSSIKLINVNFTKYNYWNREEEPNFKSWKEGYLLWADNNYKGNISIINSSFIDMNTASMYACDIDFLKTNYFRDYLLSKSDVWMRYHNQTDPKESSLIFIDRMDGDMIITSSSFQKIIGIYGSVIKVKDTSGSSTFTLLDNKFDDNFGMQAFANVIIVTSPKNSTEQIKCPTVTVENCEFINTRGCPGSYGNLGVICYWDTLPSNLSYIYNTSSIFLSYEANKQVLFNSPQIKISHSNFTNSLLTLSNSIAIVGSFFTVLDNNTFKDNGGTTAEIILYSLNNSNFLEKKPNQYFQDPANDWKSYYPLSYFGQSSTLFLDRIFRLESRRNSFQGNWGPWEGSQVLAVAITIRGWIPFQSAYLIFKDDIFRDHSGIPPRIAQYLVKYGVNLSKNAYMPPLIAVAFDPKDAYVFYNKTDEPDIVFDGVEFRNNTLSFDITTGCTYNSFELEKICSVMASNRRYLTGFIKFLSEAELREEGSVDYIQMNQVDEMSFLMKNAKIINNTLLTEGCLFSTLWAENYLLDNLTIEGNKVNPSGSYFIESAEYREPLLDLPLQNRNGIFCTFKKETIKGVKERIALTATNLKVINNTGTIFNFYPDESTDFYLLNSIFINNSAIYGPVINLLESSKAFSMNNVFIENNNPLGIFFLTSLGVTHSSMSNIYLKNNGKHASVAYINDKAEAIEVQAKYHENKIRPSFLTFSDKVTPQGGLYFLESSQASFVLSDFKQNDVYAGVIISLRSTISFDLTNISEHHIIGNSVIGNVYSSILKMQNMEITNNSLEYLPSFDTSAAIIVLDKAKLAAENLQISDNHGTFLLGTKIEGTIKNIKFYKFHSSNGASLIRLDFSQVMIENFECNDITSLFKLSETKLKLTNTSIQTLRLASTSQSLVNMIDTDLQMSQFEYLGGSDTENYFSLITGSNNNIRLIEANFMNAVIGTNKIFELTNSGTIFVVKSKFHYTSSNTQTTIFDIQSSNELILKECVFVLTGQVIQADNIFSNFYFADNTILTSSQVQNVEIMNSNQIFFVSNNLLSQDSPQLKVPPESQVHFLNNYGSIKMENNYFFSLFGSKGVVTIRAFSSPYYTNMTKNVFIDNTGVSGGAFHLDASLSSEPSINLPTINIEDSIFILNKATSLQGEKGKGGAILQTTSSATKQLTRIKRSTFIKNCADSIGGAIFFDYLPPQIDIESRFQENYASRPNHIGSYPIRLLFLEQGVNESEPYLPSQSFDSQFWTDDNQDLIKWEDIPSGIFVNHSYVFGLVDIFGQIVYDDNSSTLELFPEGMAKETRHLFSSIVSITAKNGLYSLSNFKFSHQIDEDYNISFASSIIQDQRVIPLDIPIISKSSINVQVHFRKCFRGEIVIKEQNKIICGECQPGLWQIDLNPNALACKPCEDISTICLGGDNVGPKRGYWRLNETADIVLPCPVSSSCLGNEIKDQKDIIYLDPKGKCEIGYKGNLCSNCMTGWAKAKNGQCTTCKKNVWFYFRLIFTLLLQICFIVQGFRETMVLCRDYSENRVTKLNGAILIRIFTNYLQLISLNSAIPITWPRVIAVFSEVILEISSVNQNIFAIDCLFDSEGVFGTKLIFVKLLIEITAGFILCLLGVIFWIIYFLIKKRSIFRSRRFISNVVTTIIVICFMMQPSAIQSSFSFFQCVNLYREDTPIRYFSKDYDVICWEGQHLYWTLGLGLPSLILWSFVLPFFVFNKIRKNKDKLNRQETFQKYAFLYGGYTQSKYYWELVILIRKFLFIALLIGASFYSINLEIYMSIFLIGIFYIVQSVCHPFSDSQLNFLEKLSLLSALTINFCGLYFELYLSTPLVLDIIIIGIGLMLNLIFLISFGKFYFFIQIKKLKENSKLYQWLAKSIPRLCPCLKNINFTKIFLEPKESNDQKPLYQIGHLTRLNSELKTLNSRPDSPEKFKLIIKRIATLTSPQHKDSKGFSSFEDLYVNQVEDIQKDFLKIPSCNAGEMSEKSAQSLDQISNRPYSRQNTEIQDNPDGFTDSEDLSVGTERDKNANVTLGRLQFHKMADYRKVRVKSSNVI